MSPPITRSETEQMSPAVEKDIKRISVYLGEVAFKIPAPVHLDGRWIDNDAKGKEVSFSIPATAIYKSFLSEAEYDSLLLNEKFDITLVYVEDTNKENRKFNELEVERSSRWKKIYPDNQLGLMVHERAENRKLGWGSPTYYPLDKQYVTPDGLPLRISCNRVFGRIFPVECRLSYFLKNNISMTFNFYRPEYHLKHWRDIDQALLGLLNGYMEN
ncbi:hypothetical protein [Pseudomonas nicosulfuronedens]